MITYIFGFIIAVMIVKSYRQSDRITALETKLDTVKSNMVATTTELAAHIIKATPAHQRSKVKFNIDFDQPI